ncbi:MAG: hypothetical protein ACRDG3_13635, partial [Tepidiformaceae bacterium]
MLDFAGKRWYYLWFSMIFFTIAAIALAIPPHLKPGIEFTSGSSFTEKFDNPVAQDDLRAEFSKLGFKDVTIQGAGTNTYLIRTRTLQGAPALGSATAGPTQGGEIDSVEAA